MSLEADRVAWLPDSEVAQRIAQDVEHEDQLIAQYGQFYTHILAFNAGEAEMRGRIQQLEQCIELCGSQTERASEQSSRAKWIAQAGRSASDVESMYQRLNEIEQLDQFAPTPEEWQQLRADAHFAMAYITHGIANSPNRAVGITKGFRLLAQSSYHAKEASLHDSSARNVEQFLASASYYMRVAAHLPESSDDSVLADIVTASSQLRNLILDTTAAPSELSCVCVELEELGTWAQSYLIDKQDTKDDT